MFAKLAPVTSLFAFGSSDVPVFRHTAQGFFWAAFAILAVSVVSHFLLVNALVAVEYRIKALEADVTRSENQRAENQIALSNRSRTNLAEMNAEGGSAFQEIGSEISYVFLTSLFVDASGVLQGE